MEALALGQKALEEPVMSAKPLPHIFGSAAYIQDQHAGLGSLEPKAESTSQQQLVVDSASTADSTRVPPTTRNQPSSFTQNTHEPGDSAYQPQNLKAMLEAALKGNATSLPGAVSETRLYQREGPAASSQDEQDSQQPVGPADASADLPHVLAWLEQGRGLFDDDEQDEQSRAES
ncbi:hypothetical protein ABBQ38_000873 [Trebouxia sp. C0009 RCD-2024]